MPLYPMYDDAAQLDLSEEGGAIGVTLSAALVYSPYAGSAVGAATDYESRYVSTIIFGRCLARWSRRLHSRPTAPLTRPWLTSPTAHSTHYPTTPVQHT